MSNCCAVCSAISWTCVGVACCFNSVKTAPATKNRFVQFGASDGVLSRQGMRRHNVASGGNAASKGPCGVRECGARMRRQGVMWRHGQMRRPGMWRHNVASGGNAASEGQCGVRECGARMRCQGGMRRQGMWRQMWRQGVMWRQGRNVASGKNAASGGNVASGTAAPECGVRG